MAEKVEIIVEAVDNASKTLDGIGTKLGGLASTLGKGLLIGVGAAAAGIAALGGAAAVFVKDATESQTVSARMEAQLAALGETAKVSGKDITRLADDISKVTGFDDEALIEGQTALLRFGNLSKEQFETATKAAADLAAMTGMDLTSAFQQVGRALEDPQTGFGRLKRQIGDMTEEQKLAIKAALEMGDTAKAQGIILDALAGKVKGAGEAMGQTFKGQMDRLRLTFGNLKEDIGAALLPTIQLFADKLLAFVQSDRFQQWVANLADWLQNKLPLAIQAASQFWETRLQPAIAAVWGFITTSLIPALQVVWDWLSSKLQPAIADLSAYWSNTLLPVLTDTYNWFMTELPEAIQKYKDELALLGETFAAIKDVMVLFNTDTKISMGETKTSIIDWGATFAWVIQKVVANFNFLVQQVNSFMLMVRSAMDIIKALFTGSWQEILIALITFGENFRIATYNLLKAFVGIFTDTSNWPDLKPMGRAMIDGLIKGWKEKWNSFWESVNKSLTGFIESVKKLFGIGSPSKVFIAIGLAIMQGLAAGIMSGIKLVSSSITSMAAALKNSFTTILNAIKALPWSNIGVSIIRGIITGIRNSASALTTVVRNAAINAYNAAKAALGIRSPSKLFMDLGQQVSLGMAKGIQEMTRVPVLAAEKMAKAMAPAMVLPTPRTMAPAMAASRISPLSTLPEIPMSSRYNTGGAPTIIINYSPAISTGNRAEFEAQFVPLVDQAIRRVNRGKI